MAGRIQTLRSLICRTTNPTGCTIACRRSLTTALTQRRGHVYCRQTIVRTQSSLASARTIQESSVATTNQNALEENQSPPFTSLKGVISDQVLKAVTVSPLKHTHMSMVQAEVLPLLPGLAEPYDESTNDSRAPRDLLVRAKTGTGKTLAFLVPAVEARLKFLDAHAKNAVQDAGVTDDRQFEARARKTYAKKNLGTLIISPTRELATQIAVEAQKLTTHIPGFGVHLFVGGENRGMQLRQWSEVNRDILVATPGRLRDLMDSDQHVRSGLQNVKQLILDEADTLLDMGFRADIEAITNDLPPVPERQNFMFSATVSPAIQQIARSTLAKRHKYINCVSEDTSPVHAHIPQYHTVLPSAEHQLPHLLRLIAHDQLQNPGSSKVIVFFSTTKLTTLFAAIMREAAPSSLPYGTHTRLYEIHSRRTMEQRTRVSKAFRSNTNGASVLLTSDVSARGVDYPGVTRVIQVGVPSSSEQYIHRVGRTGRASSDGRGDLVLLPWEMNFVRSQMSGLPLKSVTLADLAEQVTALASAVDASPSQTPGPSQSKKVWRSSSTMPTGYNLPVSSVIEKINENARTAVSRVDPMQVEEAFMSMLGFYVGHAGDIGTTREQILEGCLAWTTGAGGLTAPPRVSESFLQKVGFRSDGYRGGNSRSSYDRGSRYDGRRAFGERSSWGSDDRSWASRDRPDWHSKGKFRDRGAYQPRSYGRRD